MEYEAWKATWKAPLNPQQEAAVQAAQGPVLLLAVPGSGKTTVLIHRLGYLIFCLGVAPEQILTVTYTVAATRDMAARFARTFGETWANRLEFRTINGLSARIIQHYERVKGRQAFTLVTEEGRLASLVGELYRKATGEFATESTVRSLRTAITYCKNRQMTQEEIEAYQVEDIPFAKLIIPYAKEVVMTQFSPRKMAASLFQTLKGYATLLQTAPGDISEILYKLKQGEIKHELQITDVPEFRKMLRNGASRLAYAILLVGLFIGAIGILDKRPDLKYGHFLLFVSSFLIFIVMLKWILRKKRD